MICIYSLVILLFVKYVSDVLPFVCCSCDCMRDDGINQRLQKAILLKTLQVKSQLLLPAHVKVFYSIFVFYLNTILFLFFFFL